MVDVFLLIVVIVIAILLAFGMCLVLVVFGHEDDKNVAWVPKVVTVFGLWIAFASVLILPYDVANSAGSGALQMRAARTGRCARRGGYECDGSRR